METRGLLQFGRPPPFGIPPPIWETSSNSGDLLQFWSPPLIWETFSNLRDTLQFGRPPPIWETSSNLGDLLQFGRPPPIRETSSNLKHLLQFGWPPLIGYLKLQKKNAWDIKQHALGNVYAWEMSILAVDKIHESFLLEECFLNPQNNHHPF